MTATLEASPETRDGSPPSGSEVGETPRLTPPDGDVRVCPWEGCGKPLPPGVPKTRIYCDEHRPDKKGRRPGIPKDKPPKSVDITIGVRPPPGPRAKPASDQARVEAAVVSYLQLLAGIFVASGDDTCAATVAKATPQIARAIADLSKYHPQLVKILAPVEATGEGAAWIALSIAVFPVVVGILSHHGLLDARRSEILGTMSTSAEMFARSVKPEDDVVNPANDAQPAAA